MRYLKIRTKFEYSSEWQFKISYNRSDSGGIYAHHFEVEIPYLVLWQNRILKKNNTKNIQLITTTNYMPTTTQHTYITTKQLRR